ncbi:hypothetical protein I317_07055 [Kwoniella heveanensis CBS 569]|nr:hypothetical protein I317_07055 [Kwoniella heveanensis CBS 569]
MFTLPSFLTSLPFSLPSLPSISLPANIQRRFLSYILKRYLGDFVRHEALDADRIQAQISEGWVEIEGLEVDTVEINTLIPPSIPLSLTSGTLSKVTARVPVSNLWSDPLCLTLDTLNLVFTISSPVNSPSSSRKGKDPGAIPHQPEHHRDLAESVTSAADDFLHQELDAYEEAELDRSIRQSLILNQNDPFALDEEVPGSFPFGGPASPAGGSPLPANVESTTVLASLVKQILARLDLKVRNINVQIRFEDELRGATFELRISEIKYIDESNNQAESDQIKDESCTTIRAIRISGVSLHLLPLTPIRSPSPSIRPSFASSRSSSVSSSSSTDSAGDFSSMIMSQAVADLRTSTASGPGSEASMYHSAISERPFMSTQDLTQSQGSQETSSSRSATPTLADPPKLPSETLFVSFGSEDIILRMKTTNLTAATLAEPTPKSETSPFSTRLPAVDFEILVGTISSAVLPKQLATILAAAQRASQAATSKSSAGTTTNKLSAPTQSSRQPQVNATVRMKALFVSLIYDMTATSDPAYSASLPLYWSKPATTFIPNGHIRLRLEAFESTYSTKGFTGRPTAVTRPSRPFYPSATRLPRRSSTITRSGPLPPNLTITLQDASVFEYLAFDSAAKDDPSDLPPGGAFPVILFDDNLSRQYDVAPGVSSGSFAPAPPSGNAPVFPEFDCVDWRNSGLQRKAGGSEKQWKVKQKGRGILKGTSTQLTEGDERPVLSLKKDVAPNTTASVRLQPIHVFFDLSLVERLLPMLRNIAPVIRSSHDLEDSLPHCRPPVAPRQHTTESIIDDLDAQASSYGTIQATTAKPTLEIRSPLVRLDIRCPAPINRRGTWGDGGHLRSGIITLDMHNLKTKVVMRSPEPSGGTWVTPGRMNGSEGEGTQVQWDKMVLFFARPSERKSAAFVVIGPLAPEPGDIEQNSLLPSVELRTSVSSITSRKTTLLSCRIPCVQARIRQHTIEGLQFFADDITHWLDGAFGDGSAPKPRDDLRMIGSRFFGAPGSTRGSSSASSSIADEEDGELSATVLGVSLDEIDVSLFVPRADGGERTLSLKASDLDVKVESNVAGRHETALSLSVLDADFSDRSNISSPLRILGRTTPYTLTSHQVPIVQLRFSSLTNVMTETKETGISLTCSHFTLYMKELEWISDLRRFAKTPEGVFEDVVPSEVTRIRLQLHDCSFHLATPNLKGAVVVVLGSTELKTDMRSDADVNDVRIKAGRVGVLAVDELAVTTDLPVGLTDSTEAWKKAGYAHLIEVLSTEIQGVKHLSVTEEVVLDILHIQVRITACADSLATFGQLVGDLGSIAPDSDGLSVPVKSSTSLERSINVFDSIDEDAFNLVPDIASGADMIEDDLPTNLDYLDRATRVSDNRPTHDRGTGESLRMWQTEDEDEIGGETIKILYKEPFLLDEDYWDTLPILNRGYEDDLRLGKTRIRVHQCQAGIYLHDGYDWVKTRKAIEDEIRAVRRRLEKIRQLLASGQKADESIDFERATKSVLFNSVYIGLEGKGDTMDSAALIAAIDEELNDLGNADTASQSSWQTLPSAVRGHHNTSPNPAERKKTRLKGKRLTRSKKAQIEIALSDLRASVDLYEKEDETASKVEVKIKELDILDHIKTSTWKKFLMGMKADSRGNVRETDADMVRVELTGVRLENGGEEEKRLRAKILPLRLHVDQDALDFLKRFFSFKPPNPQPSSSTPASPTSPTTSKNDPFFQHVEIFPIELKLDYKPKRVDFTALREGKTIEVMNFFHFDGAEMTLRHVTLSGVTGWDRLGTTLQDLWTPDVKANQLADVISGVSPIRSVVNVGSGVADLILLPIEQYRKDGRLARGVQRGTQSFVKSTAMEMMKLGARLATGTQVILEKAEGVLGGKFGENVVGQVERSESGEGGSSSEDEEEIVSRYANQPEGVKEGMQAAYKSLSKNVNAAAQTILAVPMEVYERSGDDGPLRAVVRAVPIAVLKPMIGTTEAVSKTLLGMRNSLDPAARRELGDKYK